MSRRDKGRRLRPNLVDRTIGYFDPDRAARRLVSRAALGGMTALGNAYQGADQGRRSLRSWLTSRGDANQDTLRGLPKLRAHSRDLARNAPLATAVIDRTITFTVGTGLRALPEIDRELLGLDDPAADEWEAMAAREFNLWAESPLADAAEAQDFGELAGLALRAALESGDVFAVLNPIAREGPRKDWPWETAVQLFEADQVANPGRGILDGQEIKTGAGAGNRVYAGVEVNARGAGVAIHLLEKHPGRTFAGGAATKRIPIYTADGRRQVLHLAPKLRPGQTRGVPFLAPVIEPLKQLTTYSEAELFAAVIGAMITVVHKTPGGTPLASSDPNAQDELDTNDSDEFGLAPGTLLDLKDSDDLTVPSLGRPNAQFDPFFNAVATLVGAALGIPREVALAAFTASYSASRAAFELAQHFFRRERGFLVGRLCAPVRQAVLAESIARGRLNAPGFIGDPLIRKAWLGATWIGPARVSIDPKKENEADAIAEEKGWKTAHLITAEKTGGNWSRTIEQRGREKRQREAAGFAAPAPLAAPAPPAAPPEDDPNAPDDSGDREDT